MNRESLLIYVPELSALLGWTETSVRARISRNPQSLPPLVRIGRRVAWRRKDVEKWIDKLKPLTRVRVPLATQQTDSLRRVFSFGGSMFKR